MSTELQSIRDIEEKFEELLPWTKQVVQGFLRHRKNLEHLREDLEQDAGLALYRALQVWDQEKNPNVKGYCFLRVRGAVIDNLKNLSLNKSTLRRKEGSPVEVSGHTLREANGAFQEEISLDFFQTTFGIKALSPEENVERDELLRAALRGIENLPELQREILKRRLFQNERVEDVAAHFEISIGSVTKTYQKALSSLRKLLQEEIS